MRLYNPFKTAGKHVIFNKVFFGNCESFRFYEVFVLFDFPRFRSFWLRVKMSSKKRKAEVDKENWVSSSFLAPLRDKIMFN